LPPDALELVPCVVGAVVELKLPVAPTVGIAVELELPELIIPFSLTTTKPIKPFFCVGVLLTEQPEALFAVEVEAAEGVACMTLVDAAEGVEPSTVAVAFAELPELQTEALRISTTTSWTVPISWPVLSWTV
jgi:hypothetical protein